MFAPEVIAQERRHERISAAITSLLVLILLFFSFFYVVNRYRVPPPGAKDYQVLGSIDFGDYKQGNRNVNNFEKPVPNPSETPRSAPQPQPQQNTQPDVTPPATPPIVTPAPSPVNQPEPPKVKDPVPQPNPPKPDQPKPQPQPTQPTTTNQQVDDELLYDPSDNGGSNQGQNGDVGNTGTPDVKVLDPNGLYSFGTGEGGGLEGRRPLALPQPQYNVQEEGQLTFEFIIRPDGTVAYAKPVGPTNKPGLRDAGIEAITKWKFSPIPPGMPQKNQTVRVTIKFKLKG
ncbi:MAG: hypothetical protein OHK0039_36140 [Bacteroidia bacterium]